MLFAKPGTENTVATVELAVSVAKKQGISTLVVASNSGWSAEHLLPYVKDFHIVVIGQVSGFRGPGTTAMPKEKRDELREAGFSVYHTSHVLSGAERSLSSRFQGVYLVEIIAHSLRMFSQGVKVCVEISTMALDGDMIEEGQDIIALAGTGGGLDTAVILRPAHAQRILETKIHEILCKPYLQ